MKQETPPQKREKIFRILIALIALAALFTAFTYMLYEIISDTNRTQRLLLKAFLANEKEVFSTTPAESDPITTEKTPAEEEVLYRTSVAVDLSDHTTVIQNSTSYAVDAEALEAYVFPKHLFDTKPMILIYHSDPSEAYWQEGTDRLPASYPFTSDNQDETVTAIGTIISDVLASAGIASLHLTEPVTDIETVLAEYRILYPSLHYCLDVRRDGIYTTDGRIVKSRGTVGDTSAAQLMLAVGSDMANGSLSWQENLAAARQIAAMLSSAEPSSARPVLLRPEALNQQDTVPHLTVFVGTTGNTLSEAATAARFFARYLALFILSNCGT